MTQPPDATQTVIAFLLNDRCFPQQNGMTLDNALDWAKFYEEWSGPIDWPKVKTTVEAANVYREAA